VAVALPGPGGVNGLPATAAAHPFEHQLVHLELHGHRVLAGEAGSADRIAALLNGAVSLQKDVALLSVIGVREAVREAQIYTARTFNYSSLIGAALLFLVASIPLARFTDWYARRDQERRLQRTL